MIIRAQVSDAAFALIDEKINPTVIAVRAKLGTGSAITISRHLAVWRDANQPVDDNIDGVPASVTLLCMQLWSTAVREASEAISALGDDVLRLEGNQSSTG